MISFAEIGRLTGNRLGIFDVACPACGLGGKRDHGRAEAGLIGLWAARVAVVASRGAP